MYVQRKIKINYINESTEELNSKKASDLECVNILARKFKPKFYCQSSLLTVKTDIVIRLYFVLFYLINIVNCNCTDRIKFFDASKTFTFKIITGGKKSDSLYGILSVYRFVFNRRKRP